MSEEGQATTRERYEKVMRQYNEQLERENPEIAEARERAQEREWKSGRDALKRYLGGG